MEGKKIPRISMSVSESKPPENVDWSA